MSPPGNTLDLRFPAGVSQNSVTLSVYGTNSYGNGAPSTRVVNISRTPATPTPISGPAKVCPGQTAVYSVDPILHASPHSWVTPPGVTVSSGHNTNSINVNFSSSFTGGEFRVFGVNGPCIGASSYLQVSLLTIPPAPGLVSGSPVVCPGQTGVAFSVPAIPDATGYTWSLPPGASIVSGANTNSILVDFSTSSGTVSVYGTNCMGNGPSSSMSVNIQSPPAAAGTINGNPVVCPSISEPYSIAPVNGATGYIWSVPPGATIISGQNTNSITVDFSSSVNSGTISVYATNCSGNGTPSTASISLLPVPGPVTAFTEAASEICLTNISTVTATYTVTPVANATSYDWTVPNGAYVSSYSGNSVVITFGNNSSSGTVSVSAGNCSGSSPYLPQPVTIQRPVGFPSEIVINWPSEPCTGGTLTFTAAELPNATHYEWTFPAGVTILSGQGTRFATVRFDQPVTGGAVLMHGSNNACGAGPEYSEDMTVSASPGAAGSIEGDAMICHGSTGITYSVQPIANATTYTWSLPGGITFSAGSSSSSNTISVDVSPAFAGGAISVFGDNNGCTGSSSSLQVSAKQLTIITQQPASVSQVVRGSATFTVAAPGPVESYQWRKNQITIPGATGASYTVKGILPGDAGSYDAIVTKAGACAVTSAPAQLSIKTLAAQTDMNWILSRNILVPNVRMEGDIENLPVDGIVESIAYFDGLGRPIQKIVIHGSPEQKDIVQPIAYDNYNREARKYLPFTAGSDGYYKPGIIDAAGDYTGVAASFYGNNPNGKIAQDARPFAETIFEPSPLNRPLKDFGPGEDWHDNNKFVEHGYTTNIDGNVSGTEKIIAWTVNASGMPERNTTVTGTTSGAGYYPTGALFVKRTIDEAGHEVREYTDKQGRVILKKVYASGSMTDLDNHNNWAQTYYIYDDFGNLRFVLQPQLVKDKIAGSTTYNPDAADLAHFAFQYKYDARRRMIEKQVPGAGVVYMVYDKRDRLVMTQDGNQRTKAPREWMFTKYDAFNRPVLTGIYKDALNRERDAMQQDVNAFYNGAAQETFYEEAGSAVHGYTNRSFPGVSTESDYLTVTYYDNYGVSATWSGYNYLSEALTQTVNGATYTQPATAFNRVNGQVTATKVKVLDGGNDWLKSVNYYDDKYRVIQVVSDNHKGGTERVSNLYDFSGKILKTKTDHSANNSTHSISRRFVYDHAGRLLETWHQLNSQPEVLLSKNEYNELGQLVTKKLHQSGTVAVADPLVGQPGVTYADEIVADDYDNETAFIAKTSIRLIPGFQVLAGSTFTARIGLSQADADQINGATFAQEIDYRYNIRGWLTRINNADLTPDGSEPRDYFGMEIAYNDDIGVGQTTPKYNGLISAMKWSSNLGLGFNDSDLGIFEPTERGYKFSYDAMDRLETSTHIENTTSWNISPSYHENNLTFDLNGNIKTLSRKGKGGFDMDILDYVYNGNQLLKVIDNGNKQLGFKDGINIDNDFAYDASGNMHMDKNKQINENGIKYNHLNLPVEILKENGEKLINLYDGTGRKLGQLTYDSTNTLISRIDYVGDFFYENDTLKHIYQEEGRIVHTNGSFTYEYHLKDHLGNIRVTFTTNPGQDEYTATLEDSRATEEQASFYPSYDSAAMINTSLYNHTPGGTKSVRLSAANQNEIIGLAKSLKVVPGDTLKLEVYAKYTAPTTDNTNVGALIATAITSAFGVTSSSVGEAGEIYQTLNGMFSLGPVLGPDDWEDANAPKAFLNYILFDEDFLPYDFGFDQISTSALENGSDVPHEKLQLNAIVRKPGYVYIYLSNESDKVVNVYFDDLKIIHLHSPVQEETMYYPFGLVAENYAREGMVEQRLKYNGKEEIKELGLSWANYGSRQYMPDLGRWTTIDPMAEKYFGLSAYNYVANVPTIAIDPTGEEIIIIGDRDYVVAVLKALMQMARTKDGAATINKLASAKDFRVVISMGEKNTRVAEGESKDGVKSSYITFDPSKTGKLEQDGVERVPWVSLGHEMRHSEQDYDGMQGEEVINSQDPFGDDMYEYNTLDSREIDATDYENNLRSATGASIRRTYDGIDASMSKDEKTFRAGVNVVRGKYTVKNDKNYKGKMADNPAEEQARILKNVRQGGPAADYSMKSRFHKTGVTDKAGANFTKTKGNATVISY